MSYLVAVRNKATNVITLLQHGLPVCVFSGFRPRVTVITHEGHLFMVTAKTYKLLYDKRVILYPYTGWFPKLTLWLLNFTNRFSK
jgi:hypothetical protein